MDLIKSLVVLSACIALVACLAQVVFLGAARPSNLLWTQQRAMSDKQVIHYKRSVEEPALRRHGADPVHMRQGVPVTEPSIVII